LYIHLEQYGVPLPLTEVWQSDLSAFISVKTGFDGETLWTMNVGNQPEDFIARAAKIPHDYWIANCRQKDEPLGIMSVPLSVDGIPLSPFVVIIYNNDTTELCQRLMTLIIFESLIERRINRITLCA
jgi:hypothetical protein